MLSFRFTNVTAVGGFSSSQNFEHLTFLPEFPDSIFYSNGNTITKYSTKNRLQVLLASLGSQAIIKAIFPSRSKKNLLIVDSYTKCFHRVNASENGVLNTCIESLDPQIEQILTAAKTSKFKLYVFDSRSKIWLIEEKPDFKFQTTLVDAWSHASLVPNFMTIGAEHQYLYISATTGVWRFDLASTDEKLIIRAGSLIYDGPITAVNIKTPGSLSSLNKDVLLIADDATKSLRVANLQTGSVTSICEAYESKSESEPERFVAGKISECKLLRPKFMLHVTDTTSGSIYIGGGNLHRLAYNKVKNRCKSSVF